MHCACSQGDRPNPTCKHLWATILAVDAGGLVAGSIRPGHIPPFAAEFEQPIATDEYWEQDSNRDVYIPPQSARPGARDQCRLAGQPLAAGWKSPSCRSSAKRCTSRRQPGPPRANARSFTNSTWRRDAKNGSSSFRHRSGKPPLQRGQWGKRKPLKLRPGCQLDDIEGRRPADSGLPGRRRPPERTTWAPTQSDVQATASRYAIFRTAWPKFCSP